MKSVALLVTLLAGSLCAAEAPRNPEAVRAEAASNEVIRHAMEDFEAVLSFKTPVHAKEVRPDAKVFDGGTTIWKAPGYSLEIRQAVCGVDGSPWRYYAYGPVIVFEAKYVHADIEGRTISSVRLYRADELGKKLRAKEPNQPPEPTAMSVTPPAAQEPRQP